jgi:hypothetical protein
LQDYLEDIFALIKEYWNTSMLDQIITLVEVLSQALNDEFKGTPAPLLARVKSCVCGQGTDLLCVVCVCIMCVSCWQFTCRS